MPAENYQPQINLDGLDSGFEPNRRRKMFFALVLLLTSLALVVLKYRQFWSGALNLEEEANQTTSQTSNGTQQHAKRVTAKKAATRQRTTALSGEQMESSAPPQEVALAPLRVDVTYASGQHQILRARNSSVLVELQHDPKSAAMSVAATPSVGGSDAGLMTADERVSFSPQTAELVMHPVQPTYPLLAQQTHVQGSVVLQAKIDKDGSVKSLQVVSGPDILTSAAVEAVKQWRFKPHYETGVAVATETRITVNFTISTP